MALLHPAAWTVFHPRTPNFYYCPKEVMLVVVAVNR